MEDKGKRVMRDGVGGWDRDREMGGEWYLGLEDIN